MNVSDVLTLIVNNGSAIALLVYFIYKDNKFTETITKSLTAIEESLDVIQAQMGRGAKK